MAESISTKDLILSCPECGVDVLAWSEDCDVVEVFDEEPLWEGGPVVPVSLDPVRLNAVNRRITFQPCGHVVPVTAGLQITGRKRD